MGRLDERLVEKAAGDARLVRGDDDGEPGAVEQPDGVDPEGENIDALEPIEIADFLDQRAVAIEETRRASRASSRGAGGARPRHGADTVDADAVMQR